MSPRIRRRTAPARPRRVRSIAPDHSVDLPGRRSPDKPPIRPRRSTCRMPPAISETTVRRRLEALNRTLGSEIRQLREDAGLSRVAVARAAGVADPYLGPDRGWRPAPVERDADATRARARRGPSHPALPEHRAPDPRPPPGADAGGAARGHRSALARVHRGRRPAAQSGLDRCRAPRATCACCPRDRAPVASSDASSSSSGGPPRRPRASRAGRAGTAWATSRASTGCSSSAAPVRREPSPPTSQPQLRAAYPAHPDDALAALTGGPQWPGPALVWSVVDARATRLVGGR